MASHAHQTFGFQALATIVQRNYDAKNRIDSYKSWYINRCMPSNFDLALWQSVVTVSAHLDEDEKTGKAIYSVTVPANQYSNFTGNVQGGAVATLFDGLMICTLSLIVKKGFWEQRGVSRNLILHFFKPVLGGRDLQVECVIVSTTARMISFEASLRDGNGYLLAKCSQDVVSLAKPKL